MRASRLLSILLLLQSRGRLTAPALAAHLEVSERTVLRDMDQLSASGVPVWSERGRDGGFQLRPGWSTELTGLTESESQALFLSGLPKAATELGLGSAAISARTKMLAAVPTTMRADAIRVGERLHLDPVDWYRAATAPKFLQAVADAVWHQRILAIQYQSWEGNKERVIKPLGLVLKAGVWYIAAIAQAASNKKIAAKKNSIYARKNKTELPIAQSPRTYKLANIRSLSVMNGSFKYPTKFSLADYWAESVRRFEAGMYQNSASLRVNDRGFKLVKELSAIIDEAAEQSQKADPKNEDWKLITIPIESIEHAAKQFLAFGLDVEVIAPIELRNHIKIQIGLLRKQYGLR